MSENELIKFKKQQLIEMINSFCDRHLDEEYKQLCQKLIEKMARKRNVPFQSGRMEIWAASVIYAIGSINFLFDRNSEPYANADDICGYFGTSKSTTGQKAGMIRKMFRMEYWDQDFSTKHMLESNPISGLRLINGFIVSEKSFPQLFETNEASPKITSQKAEQNALEIIHEALECPNQKTRIKLAEKALLIFPNCADAYVLLAEDKASTLEEEREFYQKGVDAGRQALGEELFDAIFKDGEEGHFWEMIQTRSYMRARMGLMDVLWDLQKHDEAIAHCREMLILNPKDNQGLRFALLAYLSDLGRFDELDQFLHSDAYVLDCAAEWLYARVLNGFVKDGDCQQTRVEFQRALKVNPHVPEYFLGYKSIPGKLPDVVTIGSEDEAILCVYNLYLVWQKVDGFLEWLQKQTEAKQLVKVGRNEMCLCGSGIKFKKCCGS